METAGTAALRSTAADWSLAGDRQLLELLQNLHQKIMTRCQETNTKLEEMVSALDDASVSLQNVNNRFLSLSNTQFVESRVFDDDTDVSGDTADTKKPVVVPSQTSELSSLSLALQTIDKLHEAVTILPDRDSDTDTEDEDMQSTILRPKNLYLDRPLPHIIGSYNWKNKWHAGLVLEDSDTDSETSRPGNKQTDEYSSSELEDGQTHTQAAQGSYVGSVTSSEPSEQQVPPPAPSQSDVAAELARRLAGGKMPEPAPRIEDDVAAPVTNKIYKPQQPTSGTMFPDEPPPLDTTQDSDLDSYSNGDDDEDDIFAEINKKAPYSDGSKAQNRGVDIFADLHASDSGPNIDTDRDKNRVERGDVFDDISKAGAFDKSTAQPVKQKSTLFGDEEDSDLFTQKSQSEPHVKPNGTENDKSGIKKPAGAISMFGSNKGTESIGAAILNRNRRKSSTSSEESSQTNSGNNNKNIKNNFSGARAGTDGKVAVSFKEIDQIKPPIKVAETAKNVQPKERDIFDDLFARSEKAQKEAAKSQKSQEPSKKVDLFSDNIFDDIDDIFSSNIVIKKSMKDGTKDESKTKSLFDDVDDLFADIGVEKTETKNIKNETKIKGIFDSDDDLFINKTVEIKSSTQSYQNGTQIDKSPKSLDNLDLFSENTRSKNDAIQIDVEPKSSSIKADEKFKSIFESDDELFLDKKSSLFKDNKIQGNSSPNVISKRTEKTESLFSDNDGDINIFSTMKRPKLTNTVNDTTTVPETCEKKSQNEESPTNLVINDKKNKQNNNFENLNTEPYPKQTKVTEEIKEISDPMKLDNGLSSSVNVVRVDTKFNQNDRSEPKGIIPEDKTVKSSSIFSDDYDDEIDNIFGKRKKTSKPLEKHNSKEEKSPNLFSDIKAVNNENASENLNKTVDNKIQSLFDSDNDSEADLFSKVTKDEIRTQQDNQKPTKNIMSQNNNDKTSLGKPKLLEKPVTVSELDLVNPDQKENTISPEIQNQNVHASKIMLDNTKTNLDNNENLNDSLFAPPEIMKSNEIKADIFSDLFLDQPPPAFEKPKEPKKSKNVNALFDDDSDDEALFFKKNDNFLDDKPEDFTPLKTEPLFAIFHDEPPAIDTDFIQSNDPKFYKPVIEKSKFSEESTEKSIEILRKQPEVTQPTTDILDGVRQSKEEEKPKTIGKLKPMNFNINVNTLLPGASPKKQIKTNKNNEENATKSTPESPTEEVKPPLVKSVSFEGDPESPILDNKISKQRAKIQVKRRPSSRRARKEAVRKSIIDLSDEADGSGDRHDDSRDDDVVAQKEQICSTNEIKTVTDEKVTNDTQTIPTVRHKDTTDYSKEILDISDRSKDNQDSSKKDEEDRVIFNDDHNLPATPLQKAESIPVMNQETLNEILEENKKVIKDISKTEVLNINDDDIYIYRDPNLLTSENMLNDDNSNAEHFVKTLGKVYTDNSKINENKEKSSENTKSNTLDVNTEDTDDLFKDATKSYQVPKDNIFGDTSTSLPNTTKKSLFDDLSDDDDLFGGNKKNKPDKSAAKNVFSNNVSEDELFGSKKSSSKKVMAKPAKAKIEKKPEQLKHSLFGDEDDDDLFGVTKKTSLQGKEKPQREATAAIAREESKTTEQVFDDPLTLLGGDDEF